MKGASIKEEQFSERRDFDRLPSRYIIDRMPNCYSIVLVSCGGQSSSIFL